MQEMSSLVPSCLTCFSSLKLEATVPYETSIDFPQIKRRYIRNGNPKSKIEIMYLFLYFNWLLRNWCGIVIVENWLDEESVFLVLLAKSSNLWLNEEKILLKLDAFIKQITLGKRTSNKFIAGYILSLEQ
jgi:hypothetical protein